MPSHMPKRDTAMPKRDTQPCANATSCGCASCSECFLLHATRSRPSGWATGFAPAEPGQRADMPMRPFYWKAFTKEQCVTQPPEGAKELKHNGDGTFG